VVITTVPCQSCAKPQTTCTTGDGFCSTFPAAGILVERLLAHGTQSDVAAAESEADRLASVDTYRGGVVRDIWLLRLRALLAGAHGDETAYRDRYRAMATSLGFEGHMKWAEAMP
jgi:hypothetical protein